VTPNIPCRGKHKIGVVLTQGSKGVQNPSNVKPNQASQQEPTSYSGNLCQTMSSQPSEPTKGRGRGRPRKYQNSDEARNAATQRKREQRHRHRDSVPVTTRGTTGFIFYQPQPPCVPDNTTDPTTGINIEGSIEMPELPATPRIVTRPEMVAAGTKGGALPLAMAALTIHPTPPASSQPTQDQLERTFPTFWRTVLGPSQDPGQDTGGGRAGVTTPPETQSQAQEQASSSRGSVRVSRQRPTI
jgi:hypothetical protein